LTVAYDPRFNFELNLKDNELLTMKDSKKLFKKLEFIGVGLCVACCSLPIASLMLSVGTLPLIIGFLKWPGIIAMVSVVIFLGIYFFNRRKAPACKIDCACSEERKEIVSENKT
jgi:protein-S-isoprenylcysteine O-methyltransferase Ste14